MPDKFEMGPCGCLDKGMGACCYICWCPCLAYKEAAENIGKEDLGIIYCLATFPLGFGCCVLTALGDQVAQARGIPHGIAKSCLCACCDGYCCYSCSVVNESRLYKEQNGGAPAGQGMDRK